MHVRHGGTKAPCARAVTQTWRAACVSCYTLVGRFGEATMAPLVILFVEEHEREPDDDLLCFSLVHDEL